MAVSVVINGVTYPDVPSVEIPKPNSAGDAVFYLTEGDTVANDGSEVLSGKTCHNANGAVTGTMTNRGGVTGTISTKAGSYTVPEGYHDGTGSVSISSTEQAKIVAGNIKNGVTILGVEGSSMVLDTTISSLDAAAAGNIAYGKKAFVNGSEITGQLTTVTVAQDSTTKVLTIS